LIATKPISGDAYQTLFKLKCEESSGARTLMFAHRCLFISLVFCTTWLYREICLK
jgi:hypothetical protein